ncbi:MAG: DUF2892 domain-containing protein [Kiritimatiellae bacterium]|nr:DUF2892 domain-containing protein [Kiritimatiellia bacterium]
MTVERAIRVLAGTLVLAGVVLSRLVHEAWLLVVVFVAVNLVQSAFTGFCPAETLLRRTGRFRTERQG